MIEHPHLGRLIEARLEDLGMTKAEFGRRMGTTRQNVNSLLKKHSFDTMHLAQIGNALTKDFFEHLTASSPAVDGRPKTFVMIEVPPDKVKDIL